MCPMSTVACTQDSPLKSAMGEEHGPWPWLGMYLESFIIHQQMIHMKFSTNADGLYVRAILVTNPKVFLGPTV